MNGPGPRNGLKKTPQPLSNTAEQQKQAQLEKNARRRTFNRVAGYVVAGALIALGHFICINGKKPVPVVKEPCPCHETVKVNLPTAQDYRNDTCKCWKNRLIKVETIHKKADGCDSIVIDTARYSSSRNPNSPNFSPKCVKGPKPLPPICIPCQTSPIANEMRGLVNMFQSAIGGMAGNFENKYPQMKPGTGTLSGILYINGDGAVEIGGTGHVILAYTDKVTGKQASVKISSLELNAVTGTSPLRGLSVSAFGRCCETPFMVAIPTGLVQ